MPSPFPGFDPYLEDPAFWSDFHSTFINYWREAIAEALPPHYEAGIADRVYLIERDPDSRKLAFPDVSVTVTDRPEWLTKSSAVATLEPVTIPLTILEGPRETYIEILHRPDRTLITSLELLSPSNKQQPGRTEYLEFHFINAAGADVRVDISNMPEDSGAVYPGYLLESSDTLEGPPGENPAMVGKPFLLIKNKAGEVREIKPAN